MVRNNVKNLAESFFANFETRYRRKEKDAFIECTKQGFREIGYTDTEMMIQKSRIGGKNLVIGPPDADFLFTAHYDTPGRNGWIVLPFVKTLGMGLSTILGGLILVLIMRIGTILNLLGIDLSDFMLLDFIGRWIFLFAIFTLLSIFKNPHNHNDNTSGCLGVYNVATIVASNPMLREKCSFVFFDMEEAGLLGSGAFAGWRNKRYPNRENSCVINLDCVADGDILVLASTKKSPAMAERSQFAVFLQKEGFQVVQKNSSIFGYLSDHAKFPKGFMLAFLRRSRLGGLYIPNIHTNKDTICDLDQIERLSMAVVKYVSGISEGNYAESEEVESILN